MPKLSTSGSAHSNTRSSRSAASSAAAGANDTPYHTAAGDVPQQSRSASTASSAHPNSSTYMARPRTLARPVSTALPASGDGALRSEKTAVAALNDANSATSPTSGAQAMLTPSVAVASGGARSASRREKSRCNNVSRSCRVQLAGNE